VETTLAIAIAGLVVATASALAQILTFLRDRAKLTIACTAEIMLGRPPALCVTVANHGRQPTTVIEVAFQADADIEISDPEGGPTLAEGRMKLDVAQGRVPAVIMPGQASRFCRSLTEWPDFIHADDPLRPFAIDMRSRVVWGAAFPWLRDFLNSGWKPQGADPAFLTLAPRPARPVEPSWKLWKPASLRKETPAPWTTETELRERPRPTS
jgi:hypothetical protein